MARRGLIVRMVLASGLLALLVGGAFAIVLCALQDERAASDLAQHSQQVLVAAGEVERLVVDLETGEQGYALSGDEGFLQPWTAAVRWCARPEGAV